MPWTDPPYEEVSRNKAGFSDRLGANMTWLLTSFWSQMKAAVAAFTFNSTNDTSTTSLTIGAGNFTATVSAGKSYVPGMFLVFADTAAPAVNGMLVQVTSYAGITLNFTEKALWGSGTKAAWTISQSTPGSVSGNAVAGLGINLFTDLQNWATGAAIASAATVNLSTATGNTVHITGTVAISALTMNSGQWMRCIFDAACPLTYHATLNKLDTNGASVTLSAGDNVFYFYDGTTVHGYIKRADGLSNRNASVPVRQTVLSGPVDASGLPSFGGATGSATVTMSGTVVATAANGFATDGAVNRTGQGTNLSWTGLSTNGTMYLYVDVNADGTLTTGSSTLAPNYQWGSAYSTVSGQFTFNIQEMVGKVGSGAAAAQTYRVYVGEVTVAAAVVSAITWYALQGRYESGLIATLPGISTAVSATHNIGIKVGLIPATWLECVTADIGYAVGDRIRNINGTNGTYAFALPLTNSAYTVGFATANGVAISVQNKAGGTNVAPTAANWKYGFTVTRDW